MKVKTTLWLHVAPVHEGEYSEGLEATVCTLLGGMLTSPASMAVSVDISQRT